jgi:hypothetical protein
VKKQLEGQPSVATANHYCDWVEISIRGLLYLEAPSFLYLAARTGALLLGFRTKNWFRPCHSWDSQQLDSTCTGLLDFRELKQVLRGKVTEKSYFFNGVRSIFLWSGDLNILGYSKNKVSLLKQSEFKVSQLKCACSILKKRYVR